MCKETKVLEELLCKVEEVQKNKMTEHINTLSQLLPQVSLIRKKYKTLEEIHATHFNIFSILRKESDEVNLHSRFIYALLDPHGEHKQGTVFLKEFLTCSGGEQLASFMTDDEISQAEVQREHHNIDILISTPKKAIIIENKIYADYGENQLSRYRDDVIKQGYSKENIKLVYLTLGAKDTMPENEECEEVRKKTLHISYEKDIITWLEQCIARVPLLPTVRETLQQYMQLVKKLTGQSYYQGEIMEIKDLFLKNKNYMKAFQNAQDGFEEAKREIEQGFWDKLKDFLQQKYCKFEGQVDCKGAAKDCQGYHIPICKINENLHIQHIDLRIERSYDIYYGFWFRDNNMLKTDAGKKIKKNMNEILSHVDVDGGTNPRWLWRQYYPEGNKNLKNFLLNIVQDLYFTDNKINEFIESWLKEIKEHITTLKASEEFKNYEWLV